MLIISRKKNESLVIANDITVTVVEIRGDKVRLGVVSPKEVPVHRQEVFDAIHGITRPASHDASPSALHEAAVQDLQLELIRRTRFNDFNGERIHASLMRHRDLWLAVLLDRPGVPNYAEPGFLPMSGLIKLRDLPDNCWNADTLYVLTSTRDQARRLARIAEEEEWCGEIHVYENSQEIDRALGTGRQEYGLLSIWWD